MARENYHRFLEVYPTSIYGPLVKSLELGLFKQMELCPPVLELGVGDGMFSALLYDGLGKEDVIGGDLVLETLLSARRRQIFGTLAVMDADKIPLPDGCLSTVVMNNLIHHLPSRERVLNEVWRVLRPGGQFIFTDNLDAWIEESIEIKLLRKLRMNSVAMCLARAKLRLLAQSLIPERNYWLDLAQRYGWEVVKAQEFISRYAMSLCSLFELLNFKQGRPPWGPLRLVLRLDSFERKLTAALSEIIERLLEADPVQCCEGASYLFVCLRKPGDRPAPSRALGPDCFTCPSCKNALVWRERLVLCEVCSKSYPVFDGIPILLPYLDRLNDFERYLEYVRRKEIKEVLT